MEPTLYEERIFLLYEDESPSAWLNELNQQYDYVSTIGIVAVRQGQVMVLVEHPLEKKGGKSDAEQ